MSVREKQKTVFYLYVSVGKGACTNLVITWNTNYDLWVSETAPKCTKAALMETPVALMTNPGVIITSIGQQLNYDKVYVLLWTIGSSSKEEYIQNFIFIVHSKCNNFMMKRGFQIIIFNLYKL